MIRRLAVDWRSLHKVEGIKKLINNNYINCIADPFLLNDLKFLIDIFERKRSNKSSFSLHTSSFNIYLLEECQFLFNTRNTILDKKFTFTFIFYLNIKYGINLRDLVYFLHK